VRGGARSSTPVFIEERRERESRGEGVVAAINGIGFSSDGEREGGGEGRGRVGGFRRGRRRGVGRVGAARARVDGPPCGGVDNGWLKGPGWVPLVSEREEVGWRLGRLGCLDWPVRLGISIFYISNKNIDKYIFKYFKNHNNYTKIIYN
jgi:hypothetical protein